VLPGGNEENLSKGSVLAEIIRGHLIEHKSEALTLGPADLIALYYSYLIFVIELEQPVLKQTPATW